MLELNLKKLGLTDYESKTYLALLEIGEGTSGDIIKKAEIHTGKIYEILESLKNKGLISEVIKNNIFFSASELIPRCMASSSPMLMAFRSWAKK